MYWTPSPVLTITEIRAERACLSSWLFMFNIFITKSRLLLGSMLKMSTFTSWLTKLRLWSGGICRAFTLKDKSISVKLASGCCSSSLAERSLFLWSLRIFSLTSKDEDLAAWSFFNSRRRILWYRPSWILKLSILSAKFLLLELPPFSSFRCWRQLTAIENI